ncbi:MAG: 4-phosphopantetheinyl transferase family protein [Balneolaceae bacterium]|nr:MAG: 4-phosphopantetheinyl transferase family protein [Balneolaceae bacterium]
MPDNIQHQDLPDEILLCFKFLDLPPAGDMESIESHRGNVLIREMAGLWFEEANPIIHTPKNEKPRVWINGREVSVSFSHTRMAISAAMSLHLNVGCDIESVNRDVSDTLVKRIQHPDEDRSLYITIPPVRIWTIKEAGLKMIGSGLRKPMNGVKIVQKTRHLFSVEFHDGKRAKICSFQYKEHWISVCFQ